MLQLAGSFTNLIYLLIYPLYFGTTYNLSMPVGSSKSVSLFNKAVDVIISKSSFYLFSIKNYLLKTTWDQHIVLPGTMVVVNKTKTVIQC